MAKKVSTKGQSHKLRSIVTRIAEDWPLLGFLLLMLLFPVAAVGSIAWVVVAATTPDILPVREAIVAGIFIGVLLLALGVTIAMRATGDAFPNLLQGFVAPCCMLIILAFLLPPIAASLSRVRQKFQKPATSTMQHPSS